MLSFHQDPTKLKFCDLCWRKLILKSGSRFFSVENFEKSKNRKTRISIENFRKLKNRILIFHFLEIFCFFDFRFFEIFDRFFSSHISKYNFSNIDQKFSTWLDPGESWASPLFNAAKIIKKLAATAKQQHQTWARKKMLFCSKWRNTV